MRVETHWWAEWSTIFCSKSPFEASLFKNLNVCVPCCWWKTSFKYGESSMVARVSIYRIYLQYPFINWCRILSITMTMWIHPTDQEAWSHRSSALWAWAYFVDPSLPGYETDHSLQPQIDTQTSIMGQRCRDVLDCRERLICIYIYIYIHVVFMDGDWDCDLVLYFLHESEQNWYHDHVTSTLLIEALIFFVPDRTKNMCENEGAGGAGTGLLTQLALALALREDPVSCKKPVT